MKPLLFTLSSLLFLSIENIQAQVFNDDCFNATLLTSGTSCVGLFINTTYAMPGTLNTCPGDPDDDVWYKFTAVQSTHTITVIDNMDMQSVVDLRSGSCPGVSLGCWVRTTGFTLTIPLVGLTVGATYLIRIYDFATGGGYSQICVTHSCIPPSQPSGISGNVAVCQNSTNTYSVATVTGATGYAWTLPGGWTGSSATNSITATASSASGHITVSANNACGSSAVQTLPVTVNLIPAQPGSISGSTSVCQNSTNTYTVAIVSGATSGTWTLPSGWTGSSATNSITATASSSSGNVTVAANNACGSSTAQTLSVTVNPLPATPTITVNMSTLASGSSSGNQWYLNGNPISGATSQFHTAAQNGLYTVCVTDANGCSSCSAPYNFSTTGIAENNNANDISVYPNPGSGRFNIQCLTPLITGQPITIDICNVFGEKVFQSEIKGPQSEIDLSSQPDGIYFLRIRTAEGTANKKLIMHK
ncbi:MAG: T9SS type A sorting domain-containing protein [Bacteroidetes bacterium]|nr:MAG: T9SS type A sorting domain-containing protein [Bacteroidota bacterium]